MADMQQQSSGGRNVTYFVDDEPQVTSQDELTVQRILEKAGARMEAEQQSFLYELRGEERIEHNDPSERIQMRENIRFSTKRESGDVEVGGGTEHRSAETPTTALPAGAAGGTAPRAVGGANPTERAGGVTQQTAKRELRGEEEKEERAAHDEGGNA